MHTTIYLDYMATTPLDSNVLEAMLPYLQELELAGNSGSTHDLGIKALKAVERAREQVSLLINAEPESIIFTSGATESLNLAIKGAAEFHQRKGKHIITTQVEHKAVLDTCQYLQQKNYEVTYLKPDSEGIITAQQVAGALRDDTILVAIMAVNNEIGTIYDIASIAACIEHHQAILVVDAAQAAGKIPLDCKAIPIDLLAISGHKLYGPKGIGALYIRRKPRVRIAAQMHGGGQEQGLRSGTLPTHQIVGLGKACELARQCLDSEPTFIATLHEQFIQAFADIPHIKINGATKARVPHNINISLQGIDAEALLAGLPRLAMSTTSACNSIVNQASYVLKAIGATDRDALSSIRISLGRYTTPAEVKIAAEQIAAEVIRLRKIAPR